MKTTIKFLSVLTFLISFASCESIEDLADVTFNTTLTDEIVVHIDQTNGTSAPFNMTQTISKNISILLSDEAKYLRANCFRIHDWIVEKSKELSRFLI